MRSQILQLHMHNLGPASVKLSTSDKKVSAKEDDVGNGSTHTGNVAPEEERKEDSSSHEKHPSGLATLNGSEKTPISTPDNEQVVADGGPPRDMESKESETINASTTMSNSSRSSEAAEATRSSEGTASIRAVRRRVQGLRRATNNTSRTPPASTTNNVQATSTTTSTSDFLDRASGVALVMLAVLIVILLLRIHSRHRSTDYFQYEKEF